MSSDAFVVLVKQIGEFVVALAVPVVIASPLVAILIDQILKRLPFWRDGYAGWANVVLNMLFSAGLYIAARLGAKGEYEEAIRMSVYVLPIVVRVVVGLYASFKLHGLFKQIGIGKSITEESKPIFKTPYPGFNFKDTSEDGALSAILSDLEARG